LGQTGVIGDLKDYYLLVTVSQISKKKESAVFAPNKQTVLELSFMKIYDIYYKKIRYNVIYEL
jgi:hypothetical protein